MLEERFYSLGRYIKDIFDERVHKISVTLAPGKSPGAYNLCTGGVLNNHHDESADMQMREQLAGAKDRIRQKFKLGKFMASLHTVQGAPVTMDAVAGAVDEILKDNEIMGISFTLLPDSITPEMAAFLKKTSKYTSVWVEASLHTMHDATLERIGMTHKYSATKEAISNIARARMHVSAHMVLGLPGETEEMMEQTMLEVTKLGLGGVNIHNFHVSKNTQFEKEYAAGGLKLLERDEYVRLVCNFIEILPPSTVLHGICDAVAEERLVAPEWMRLRKENLDVITNELEKRDSVQGCKRDVWKAILIPAPELTPVEPAANA